MGRITLLKGDETFEFQSTLNESVLDQALAHGVPADYSCRRGDCGQCAATLVSGEIEPLDASRPLTIAEEVLLCNVRAKRDVAFSVPYFSELESIPVRQIPCKIHELTRLAESVLEVVLRLPPTADFRFLPGQFIRLLNREQVTRSYSLAGPPHCSGLLRIHVRKVEDGRFSNYWFYKARIGDLLQLKGPHGRFFLRAKQVNRQTLFLATGTGIAPINAILEGLNNVAMQRLGKISVYWGNRHREDEYLAGHLTKLCSALGVLYQPLYSREPALSHSARHVQDAVAEKYASLEGAAVFACGSSQMVASARGRLVRLGLAARSFVSDAFTAS